MRKIAAVALLTALVAVHAPPAAAKGPWRISVRGPGITGEVDLLEEPAVLHRGPWSAYEVVGDPLPFPRAFGPRYVVTWYAAMGGDPHPTPLVDRVAFYPAAGTVQVLVWSDGFGVHGGGWYEEVPVPGRHLAGLIENLAARGAHGPPGYAFAVRDGHAAWEAIDRPSTIRRLLAALAGLTPW